MQAPAQTTIPEEASGLRDLALQMRLSALDSENQDYVRLFLSAAMALEERAARVTADTPTTH